MYLVTNGGMRGETPLGNLLGIWHRTSSMLIIEKKNSYYNGSQYAILCDITKRRDIVEITT